MGDYCKIATMKLLLVVIHVIIFKSWNINAYAETDPCSEDIYKTLPRAAYRGGACPYNRDKQTCDAALITGWYRAMVNGKNLKMQESPASLSSCGTKWPLWMNGTHPGPDEGIVNRTLLQPIYLDTTTIQVKNCQDEYYVYYLRPTDSCPEAYCFGETDNDPCPPFDPCDMYEHQKINYNSEQSSYCTSSYDGTCGTTYERAWVTFRDKDHEWFLNVSSRPVRSGACGSPSPMWIKEEVSIDKDGVKTLKLCVGSEKSVCEKTVTIRSKECRWFNVYEAPAEVDCGRLCVDDPSASCAVLPESTSTTSKTTRTSIVTSKTTTEHTSTTQLSHNMTKEVTPMGMSDGSRETHTTKKIQLSSKTSGMTTEKGKSNTTPVYTDDNTTGDNRHTVDDKQHKHTGLPDDSQHTMVIAVAVAVSVVAIVILAVVLVAFRRKCFERQEKLQQPDPDDHYYLHITEPNTSQTEKGEYYNNGTDDREYADINDIAPTV